MADEALQETLALLKIVSLTDEDIKKGEVFSKEEAFEFIWSEIGKGFEKKLKALFPCR